MYQTRGFKSTNPYVTAPKTLDPATVTVERALGATVPETMRLPPRIAEPVPPPTESKPLPAVPSKLREIRPGDQARAEDINQIVRFLNMSTFGIHVPQVASGQLGGIISGNMQTGPRVKRGRIITKKRKAS